MLKNAIWLFCASLIAFAIFLPSYTQMQDLKELNRAQRQEIESLVQYNHQLNDELQRLKEDPVYLEKIAREKMGIIREGEVVYKIMPADGDDL